jgi:hypothetical protein
VRGDARALAQGRKGREAQVNAERRNRLGQACPHDPRRQPGGACGIFFV